MSVNIYLPYYKNMSFARWKENRNVGNMNIFRYKKIIKIIVFFFLKISFYITYTQWTWHIYFFTAINVHKLLNWTYNLYERTLAPIGHYFILQLMLLIYQTNQFSLKSPAIIFYKTEKRVLHLINSNVLIATY